MTFADSSVPSSIGVNPQCMQNPWFPFINCVNDDGMAGTLSVLFMHGLTLTRLTNQTTGTHYGHENCQHL